MIPIRFFEHHFYQLFGTEICNSFFQSPGSAHFFTFVNNPLEFLLSLLKNNFPKLIPLKWPFFFVNVRTIYIPSFLESPQPSQQVDIQFIEVCIYPGNLFRKLYFFVNCGDHRNSHEIVRWSLILMIIFHCGIARKNLSFSGYHENVRIAANHPK